MDIQTEELSCIPNGRLKDQLNDTVNIAQSINSYTV